MWTASSWAASSCRATASCCCALETGTATACAHGRGAPFPTNTSDALTSGGTYAIAGAVERMYQHLLQHSGQEPACIMTGGAGWKMAPA